MFLKHITLVVVLLFSNSYSFPDNWKRPTVQSIVVVAQQCLRQQNGLNIETMHEDPKQVKCFFENLGLWDSRKGFRAERLVHAYNKKEMMNEILVTVGYCNDRKRQKDDIKWALQAYSCFAAGPIGGWTNFYIRNAYKQVLKENGLK